MDKQIVRNICGKEEGKIIYEVKTEKDKTQEMIRIGAKKKIRKVLRGRKEKVKTKNKDSKTERKRDREGCERKKRKS